MTGWQVELLPRRVPTSIAHFTHLDNLAQIAVAGLKCDSDMGPGQLVREAGEPSIKELRRQLPVTVEPGGVVADYVPFYFAPRSPMLFRLAKGGVPTFTGDTHDLVYLVTTVESLLGRGRSLVYTDRNAALSYAEHSNDLARLDELVDWPLMGEKIWTNTPEDGQRKERRMAECLVHREVAWRDIETIYVFDARRRDLVVSTLEAADARVPSISVSAGLYF